MMHVRIVRRYQRGNQSPLIEEEQIREWSKERGTKVHTMIYKTLHRKPKIGQHESLEFVICVSSTCYIFSYGLDASHKCLFNYQICRQATPK